MSNMNTVKPLKKGVIGGNTRLNHSVPY